MRGDVRIITWGGPWKEARCCLRLPSRWPALRDATFTHMSGRQQTREKYFADIENGNLRYFTIGIDSPVVIVDGDTASVTFTSVLNANAYGARGTYRMSGTHHWEKRDGEWCVCQ